MTAEATARALPTPEQFAEWRKTHPPIAGAETPETPAAGGEDTSTVEQPGQGRGDVDHLAGLYDLSTAPDHLRPHLEEELRKINAGISRRFQEHAEQRSQWEPLTKIEGISDVPAEDLEDLLAVRNMIAAATDEQNPDDTGFYEWWDQVGEHFGFFNDPEGGQGGADPEGGEDEPQYVQELRAELESMRERLDGTDQQSRVQQAEQAVQAELSELAEKHSLDEPAQNRVLQLAYAYGGAEDALQKGLADYLEITGQAENDLVGGAEAAQPGPATTGGQPAVHEGEPMRFGDSRLREAAMARLNGASTGAAL